MTTRSSLVAVRSLGPAVEWCDADWRLLAACRRYDPEYFFPERARDKRRQIERAKRVCAGCPVRDECLRLALDRGEPVGIWGGTTVEERRNMRRKARRARRIALAVAGQDLAGDA